MARTHFINPYTFVPLVKNGPICTVDANDLPSHAWLQRDRFTGKIHCKLQFITPAVIPGETKKGEKNHYPGSIKAYVHNGRVAIPGSRLRGHLCNLMRAINSSPLVEPKDEEHLFRRIDETVKKGFLIHDASNNSFTLQEVTDEILVAHPKRAGRLPTAESLTEPKCYQADGRTTCITFTFPNFLRFTKRHPEIQLNQTIPGRLRVNGGFRFNECDVRDTQTINALRAAIRDGLAETTTVPVLVECEIPNYTTDKTAAGTVYFLHPETGPSRTRRYRKYMVASNVAEAMSTGGYESRWVAFDNWSGMDGESRNTGTDGTEHGHWNAYHVVDLSQWKQGKPVPVPEGLISNFKDSIKNLAAKQERELQASVREMARLSHGTFVYFTKNSQGDIKTMGRHYRYMVYIGGPKNKIQEANKKLRADSAQCPVNQLSGWSGDNSAMKSRLWVEMAHGPDVEELKKNKQLINKNLRILSSQPPKQHRFYLNGGDYDEDTSTIRGRKFYWHDPKWNQKMWDNEDLNNGDCAFENPSPDDGSLWKQWSRAEVLWLTEEQQQSFTFTIRMQNLSRDELYLLLTALVGFEPTLKDGCITPLRQKNSWCHKIGHARPFLGSAVISITGLEQLTCNDDTWQPECLDVIQEQSLWNPERKWLDDLKMWQAEKLPDKLSHIKALKRIMDFEGAYRNLNPGEEDARITYPLGQDISQVPEATGLTWQCPPGNQPKTFTWFGRESVTLPKAESNVSQALPVYIRR